MVLDSTARESNARDSFKKYMIDNLNKTENEQLTFDKGLTVPKIQGIEVDKWIAVHFGAFDDKKVATLQVNIICASRKDPEYYRLTQLRDKVVGYLVDGDGSSPGRITLYKSNVTPWLKIGTMQVFRDQEAVTEGGDGTKFKIIPIRLRWGAKL